MKKAVSLLLCLVLLTGLVPLNAFAQEEPLQLIISSDFHYSTQHAVLPQPDGGNPFAADMTYGKMFAESVAVVSEFLKQIENDESKYVILTGDMSDTPRTADMQAITDLLRQFEQKTNKTVLASIGNHELLDDGTVAKFKRWYADLGYDHALAVDPDSASYTVDLDNHYRLIQIDTNHFSEARIQWIEAQVRQAEQDGVKLLSTTHANLFDHYLAQPLDGKNTTVPKTFNLPDRMIDWGIRFNFSGHTHMPDNSSYSNENGIVYDLVSPSLTTFPAGYRRVEITDREFKLQTVPISSIDTSLVPQGLSKEMENLLKNNFPEYARLVFLSGTFNQLQTYLSVNAFSSLLHLSYEQDTEVIAVLDHILSRIKEAANMPLYGENSLSAYAAKKGMKLPAYEADSALDLCAKMFAVHNQGNENAPSYQNPGKLCLYTFRAIFSYAMESVTKAELQTLLQWAVNRFGLNQKLPAPLLNGLVRLGANKRLIQAVITAAGIVIINDFIVDFDLDDTNLTLPVNTSAADSAASGAVLNRRIRVYTRAALQAIPTVFLNIFLFG